MLKKLHNASFETKFLKKYLGEILGNFWCTRVASQLLANAMGNRYNRSASGNGLVDIVKDYIGIDLAGKGSTQIEDWYVRPLSMEKLEYGAGDIMYLYQLKEIFESVLIPDMAECGEYEAGDTYGLGMAEVLDIEMKFIQVEAECEFNGLPINHSLAEQFENAIEDPATHTGEKLKVAGELCELIDYATYYPMDLNVNYKIPTSTSIKHLNSSDKLKTIINKYIGNVETAESKQVERMCGLLDEIYKNKTTQFYSEEEGQMYQEFLMLNDEDVFKRNQVAKLLLQYKKLAKQASMRISRYIHPVTGRIHYNLNSLGAATGRCSSSSP